MIATLRGTVQTVSSEHAVIEVGGVGYLVRMTGKDIAKFSAGQEIFVFTHLSVSQDSMTLYGFSNFEEQKIFLSLQKASGIGPRAALSIVSALSPEQLYEAITNNDIKVLTKAPGIGKKGAQKIILELAGSIDFSQINTENSAAAKKISSAGYENVAQGLVSLGWNIKDAEQAVSIAAKKMGLSEDFSQSKASEVLRQALKSLDKKR